MSSEIDIMLVLDGYCSFLWCNYIYTKEIKDGFPEELIDLIEGKRTSPIPTHRTYGAIRGEESVEIPEKYKGEMMKMKNMFKEAAYQEKNGERRAVSHLVGVYRDYFGDCFRVKEIKENNEKIYQRGKREGKWKNKKEWRLNTTVQPATRNYYAHKRARLYQINI